MITIPIHEVEIAARKCGLRTQLLLVQKATLTNGYNPLTGKITLRPYMSSRQCAMRLAHELKHQIDLQFWPGWLALTVYWPVIILVGVWAGSTFGWVWFFPAIIAAYLIHPFELSANIYALRFWKMYEEILLRSQE